ncbi:hypothetical protein KCU81_g4816, partial [Aureobasidium melanogenum]
MRRRRALISAQPWWQNSSYSRGASGSAPTANLVTTGKANNFLDNNNGESDHSFNNDCKNNCLYHKYTYCSSSVKYTAKSIDFCRSKHYIYNLYVCYEPISKSAIMARQGSNPERLPVIDHNLIHMDLNHWDRPFAHEDPHLRDDGSPLRLMNPDPTPTPPVNLRTSSTSISPDAGPNNPHGFLQRQRSALTAALLSIKRSFSSQDVVPRHASYESQLQPSAHPSAHPSPLHIPDKNTNKLTMPSEAILAGVSASRPISSQSAMSNNTIIRHQLTAAKLSTPREWRGSPRLPRSTTTLDQDANAIHTHASSTRYREPSDKDE